MLPVQLEAAADSRRERGVWFQRERQLRGGDRTVELSCLCVRGCENIGRACVLSSREIGGPLRELDRLIRVAKRRIGRGGEQPREAGDGGKPVRLELQRPAKPNERCRKVAARAQHAADVVVRLGVRWIEAQRFAKM